MIALVYAIFVVVFLVNWDVPWVEVPKLAKVVPDMLAGLLGLLVIARFAAQSKDAIRPPYVLFALFIVGLLLTGVVANRVDPGAVMQAIRTYVMHIPLFLLPAVYCLPEWQVKRQLTFILGLALIQLPVALHQRFVLSTASTGDVVGGTLGNSKALTLVMIAAIAIVWALHLKNRIGLAATMGLILLLFTPTMINETTGTLFLLPFAFLVPLLAVPGRGLRSRYTVTALAGGCVLVVLFAGVYNTFYGDRWGGSIFNVFADGRFIEYELRGEETSGGLAAEVGRLEGVLIPIRTHASDPVKLLVGAGAGNVQAAPLEFLEGAHSEEYERLGANGTTLSILLWETGFVGVILFFVFLAMVFRDAWVLRNSDSLAGALALGWLGVIAVLAVASIYVNVFSDPTIIYGLAYFSGYVAAMRGWEAQKVPEPRTRAPAALAPS